MCSGMRAGLTLTSAESTTVVSCTPRLCTRVCVNVSYNAEGHMLDEKFFPAIFDPRKAVLATVLMMTDQ